MRGLSQRGLLALANAALVLLTTAAVAGGGAVLLRRLVSEQAEQRVAAAAAAGAREVDAAAHRLAASAALLAERPTLQRLGAAGQEAELAVFLDGFRATSGLTGAAVLRDGRVLATSGGPPPAVVPTALVATDGSPAPRVPRVAPAALLSQPAGPPVLRASAPSPGGAVEVVVWRAVDAGFAAELSRQVGMAARVVAAGGPAAAEGDALRVRAPLPAPLAQSLAVEASLPRAELRQPLRRLLGLYALAACAAGALALVAGLLLGRRLGAPARALGRAAARIGAGDLTTPVAATGPGELGQLAATLEDMRQRLQGLTGELSRREGEARAVLGGIVEGVVAVDGERRVSYLNPGAAALLGVSGEEARGRFCGDLLRPEAAGGDPPCRDRCPIVHARGRGTARVLERIRPANGPPRTVVVSCSPPAGGSQVLVLRDETELEAGRRVREAILANLSHELKTPLAAQLASVELLRDGLDGAIGPAEARELVSSLERSTLRLMGLVDNLLASSRLQAGEWGTRDEPVDLRAVAEEAAAVLAPLFVQRRQRLEWELPALPVVRGDRTQLLQVLLNLLGNANKFAPEGTAVRVGGGADAGAVSLWVEDAGPGLPAGGGEALFERFRRASGVAPHGVGLGLWIVRALVERHGGSVSGEPGREGGARFTVRLPLPEASAA